MAMPSAIPNSASPAIAASETGVRRLDIQGLRAIAVLAVICYHAGLPVPGGFVGVDIFFVISGFVITALLTRSLSTSGRISFREFYARRFKRLYPALALMVTATLVLSWLSLLFVSPFSGQEETAITGVSAMLMAANIALGFLTGGYFDQPAKDNPLLNTWSLSVEEQFYLIFPAALALAWFLVRHRRDRVRKRALVVIVLAIGSSSLAIALTGSVGDAFLTGFFSPITRAWEFAAGSLIALCASRALPNRLASEALGLTGLLGIGVSLFVINEVTRFPGPWTLLPVLATVAVIIGARHERTIAYRMLSTAPAVRIGDWSYSLYLWHWPLIAFAVLALPGHPWVGLAAAITSTIPALASFRFVEEPLRRATHLTRQTWSRLLRWTLVPPLAIGGLLWLACTQGFWSPEVQSLRSAIEQPHASGFEACSIQRRLNDPAQGACGWNLEAPGAPIYLVGDSTADHFSEALIDAGIALDRPVQVVILPACSFKDLYLESKVPVPWRDERGCRAVYEDTLTWLRRQQPGLIVISEINSGSRDPDAGVGPSPDAITYDPAQKAEILASGLQRTVEELQTRGFRVMLVQPAPAFEGDSLFFAHLCSLPEALSGSCAQSMTRQEADRIQGSERAALESVAKATGAYVFDPRSWLCPNDLCGTELNGTYLYRDRVHLSVQGSRLLAPAFTDAIGRASPAE